MRLCVTPLRFPFHNSSANEPTIDLHIFASRSFNVEATFESRSRLRAIEFSDTAGRRGGLGDVVDEEARHAVFNDFWR